MKLPSLRRRSDSGTDQASPADAPAGLGAVPVPEPRPAAPQPRGPLRTRLVARAAPGSPPARSSKRAKLIVYAIAALAPVAFVLSLLALGVASGSGSAAATAPAEFRFAGEAEAVAEAFLAGLASPVPAAISADDTWDDNPALFPDAVLGWVGADRVTSGGTLIGETHRFVVGTSAGNYILGITIDGSGALAGSPSLEAGPWAGADSRPSTIRWAQVQGLASGNSPGLVEQAEAWADAYAADDRTALRRIAGDDNAPDGLYVGLGGFEVIGVAVDRPVVPRATEPDQMWVQIELSLARPGTTDPTVEIGMDLLLEDGTTRLPKIVAWGPFGSASLLTPFGGGQP